MYTQEEKKARCEKLDKIIDFVIRRDLDREYVRTYNRMKEEVWHFISHNKQLQNLEKKNSGLDISVFDSEEEEGERDSGHSDDANSADEGTENLP